MDLFQRKRNKEKLMCMPSRDGRKEGIIMEKKINATEKFCTKCGKKFLAVGREVICPACKQAAAEATKKAAVLKAKRASWTGESVPVRISGRASTIIRQYGATNNLPFVQALDALLQASAFFQSTGKAWEDVTPYRSHRRDKHATETEDEQEVKTAADKLQEVPQAVGRQEVTSKPQEVKAAKKTVKTTSKAAGRGGKA